MSILKYFQPVKKSETDKSSSIVSEVQLPDPHGLLSSKVPPEAIAMANATITETIMERLALLGGQGFMRILIGPRALCIPESKLVKLFDLCWIPQKA